MAPVALLAAIAWMSHSAAGLSERPAFESGHLRGTDDRVVVELPTARVPIEKSQKVVDMRSSRVSIANSKVVSLKDFPAFGGGMGLLLEPEMQQENKPMSAWLEKLLGLLYGTGDRVVNEPQAPAPIEKSIRSKETDLQKVADKEAVEMRSSGFAVVSSKVVSLKDYPAFGGGMGLRLEPEMQQEDKPMPAWPRLDKLRTQFAAVVTWGLGLLHRTGDRVVNEPQAPAPIEKSIRSKETDLQKVADKEAVEMRSSGFTVVSSKIASLKDSPAFRGGMGLLLEPEMQQENKPMLAWPRFDKLRTQFAVVAMSAVLLVTLMLRRACRGPTKEDSSGPKKIPVVPYNWPLGYHPAIEWT